MLATLSAAGEHFRIVHVATPEQRQVTGAELELVLQGCADTRGVWRRWEAAEYSRILIKHPSPQLERADYIAMLEKELIRALNRFAGEMTPFPNGVSGC